MINLLWLPFAGKTTADWQSNEIWNQISHKYGLPNSERVRGEKTRRMPAKNSRQMSEEQQKCNSNHNDDNNFATSSSSMQQQQPGARDAQVEMQRPATTTQLG